MKPPRAENPSRRVLHDLPGRVLAFLQALGTWPALAAAMARGGFGPADHAEGCRLLSAVFAYGGAWSTGQDSELGARSAHAEIERWVRVHFRRYQLALERLHPDAQSPFLGIEAPARNDAVSALGTLLGRLEQLERVAASAASSAAGTAGLRGRRPGTGHASARSRNGRPEQALAMLRTLEGRGLNAAERERLEQWLVTARAAPSTPSGPEGRDLRQKELLELYRWYTDWATTAKSTLERKQYLIALGLAKRGWNEQTEA